MMINATCRAGDHKFESTSIFGDEVCSVCGARCSERGFVCSCGGTAGRDKTKWAHSLDPSGKSCPILFLTDMMMLHCRRCGINWSVFLAVEGTWYEQGVQLEDICESTAEIRYYDMQTEETKNRLIPQLFVPVAYQKGYFIDWYDPLTHEAIEIDGPQHLNQIKYDRRRDQTLLSLGYWVTRIPIGRLES